MTKIALVVTAATCLVLAAASGPAGAAAPPAPTFNPNLVLPNSSGAAEPSIRTDSKGRSFVIGPTGVPAGCKAWRVTHDGSSAAYLGFPDSTVGGGDCDYAIGPAETGTTNDNVAYSSLTLPNITVGHSTDGGATWTLPNPAAAQVAGDDRMWMAADPTLNSAGSDTDYMTYHDVTAGEIETSVSVDGGQTYTQRFPVITDPTLLTFANGVNGSNELGNIVARRDGTGALTLYTIFTTQEGAATPSNNNRVWEAVGTVTNASSTTPVVTWKDYEVYHGPTNATYDKIFPATAVDSAGHVYAVWTDGLHVYFKSSPDGATWDPAAKPTTVDAGTTETTTLMPWVVAGGPGMVDVVWYGATGGAAGANNDAANQWVVWLAQTLDGGATWTAAQASDHVIHKGSICLGGLDCNLQGGDRTLLDFFQVALDPTNGAATIAYADDHAAPGTPVVYFTRQCSGASLLDGSALTNDCVTPAAPAALPQGSTCPGPQIVDAVGDAPNNYPGGDGSNIDTFDIENASFAPADATHLKITLTVKDLSALPPTNLTGGLWRVYWTYGGTSYAVEAGSNGKLFTTYSVGTVSGGSYTPDGNATVDGSYNAGANGTITWTVALSDIGSPPASAMLTKTFADDHGAFTVGGTGLFYTAAADRAPDSGFGADANIAGCSAPGGNGGGTTTGGGGGSPPPSGGGSSGGGSGGSGGGSSTPTPLPPAPPGQALPPEIVPGAGLGGVAGTSTARHRVVRAHGVVRGRGGAGSVVFQLDLSRGPGNKLVVQDVLHGVRFHSLRLASIRFGDHSARIAGVGVLDGARVPFVAVAIDNGARGDVFRIAWRHRASLGGVLVSGNVLVH
jgi:hypothetical protein